MEANLKMPVQLEEETLDVMSDPKLTEAIKQGEDDVRKERLIDWEDIKREFSLQNTSS